MPAPTPVVGRPHKPPSLSSPPPLRFLLPGGSLALPRSERRRRRRSLGVSLALQVLLVLAMCLLVVVGPPTLRLPQPAPQLWVEVMPSTVLHYTAPPQPHPLVVAPPVVAPRLRRKAPPPKPAPKLTPKRSLQAAPRLTPSIAPNVAPNVVLNVAPRLAPPPTLAPAPRRSDPPPVSPAPNVSLGTFGRPEGIAPTPGATVPIPVLGGFGRRTQAAPPSAGVGVVANAGFDRAASADGASAPSIDAVPAATVRGAGFGSATAGVPAPGDGARARVELNRFATARPAPAEVSVDAPPAAPDFTPPAVVAWPQPDYTAAALAHHIEGAVVLSVRLRADGTAQVLAVERSLGYGLDDNARAAATRLNFRPARRHGQPVDWIVRLTVNFRLAN